MCFDLVFLQDVDLHMSDLFPSLYVLALGIYDFFLLIMQLSVEVKANESDRMLDRVPFSAPSSLGTEHIHTKPNDS